MVEFGLKLEDNKVADWSEHYIQYEKLKSVLRRFQNATKRFDDLASKRSDDAIMIKRAFDQGVPTPYASRENLVASERSISSTVPTNAEPTRPSAEVVLDRLVSERSGLFETADPTDDLLSTGLQSYGSQQTIESSRTMLSRALGKAAVGVSDYFSRSFERQVRDTLKEMTELADKFESELLLNKKNVKDFYLEKANELESRLQFLVESVSKSRNEGTLPPAITETEEAPGDSTETPLVHHRKSSHNPMTMAKHIARRIQQGIHLTDAGDERAFHSPLVNRSGDEDDEGDPLDPKTLREVESIQRALVDQYRTVKLLHNYAIMNYTGFVKIVKKHDKTVPDRKGRFKNEVQADSICNTKIVERLEGKLETLYANWFCDKNIGEARAQMLPKRGDGLEMDWSQLRLGYRMGMSSVLGLWVCWDCIWGMISEGHTTIGGRTAFPVFRACGGLLILQWFWGMSTWVWSRYRVNYIYLFDFNPQIVDSPISIFNDAVDNTLVFLTLTLIYYKAGAHDIPGRWPAGVYPFVLVLFTLGKLIFPLRTRIPMWKSIWLVITAPATSPSFFHGYIGDIFTSMVKVFQDMVWTAFFVGSGDWLISEDKRRSTKHVWSHTTWYTGVLIPLVTLFPLWIRFNQCMRKYMDTGERLPHLANAFKYALSQTVTLFGAFHPLYMRNQKQWALFQGFWTLAFVTSSLYSFVWDVYMDWGLGRKKHKMLGNRLMYPSKVLYYAIIAIDLVLRFAWVLTLVPPKSGAKFALPQYLTAVSMGLELFRRTIWGFLRLENEHRSNTAGFRRVGFVPLHFSTGHGHGYKQEKEHRGFAVLLEVLVVTLVVVGACAVSVVAAQHATEREETQEAVKEL